ncbi:HET-domain-containing protein [Durotheca rogersii]|uniref:HET-domain-containing protein n=1 Tax=Durotheca rogersii TaxID=419775 RepID=UPI00222093A6|nr:HET-domain-containing protein [Durotheca rogersii]KAI5868504.1 HET-domain-containing protein [Durotheca rogersii]
MLSDFWNEHFRHDHWKSKLLLKLRSLTGHEEDETDSEDEDEDFKPPEEPYRPPAYPYRRLVDDDIRLLRITSGSGPVECTLHQLPLGTVRHFHPLSYVWGDVEDRRSIILEGRPFTVTKNLYEALYQFRQRPRGIYPEDYFWIDAICINQEDTAEKSLQIPRMADIYLHPNGFCTIWLGPLPETPAKSFPERLRKAISPQAQIPSARAIKITFKKAESMWSDWEPVDEDDNTLPDAGLGDSFGDVVRVMRFILVNPWFSRVWTIQESCLRYPKLFIGHLGVDLDKFASLFQTVSMQLKYNYTFAGSARLVAFQQIDELQSSLQRNDENDSNKLNSAELLGELFRISCRTYSTDPRDQVYGLLGLFNHLTTEKLPAYLAPNYDLCYEQIFWDYASFVLQFSGDLGILEFRSSELQNTPSWVSDFRNLSTWLKPQRRQLAKISPDNRVLYLEGYRIGTFCSSIVHFPLAYFDQTMNALPAGLPNRLRELEELILKPSAALRQTTVEEVFYGIIKKVVLYFFDDDREWFEEIFNRLLTSKGRLKTWYARRRATGTTRLIERLIAGQLAFSFMLLSDGTVLELMRTDASTQPGDLVYLFKGAQTPSLVRPSGTGYTFISQCSLRGGPLEQQFDDEFWAGRDTETIGLV